MANHGKDYLIACNFCCARNLCVVLVHLISANSLGNWSNTIERDRGVERTTVCTHACVRENIECAHTPIDAMCRGTVLAC